MTEMRNMAWDFETDPEFQKKPLHRKMKAQGLWACHLDELKAHYAARAAGSVEA